VRASNTTAIRRARARLRMATPAALLLCVMCATAARASEVLLSDTTLVTGSETGVFSFDTPGAGTVSVQLTNLDWPQALSSLSFVATTASHVLSSWSDPGSAGSHTLSFQVTGSGAFFADVTAVAGGPLDLGVYSFSLEFTPAIGPVPLPASGWLLLGGMLALIGLRRLTLESPGGTSPLRTTAS
jgi:hypothetical protein